MQEMEKSFGMCTYVDTVGWTQRSATHLEETRPRYSQFPQCAELTGWRSQNKKSFFKVMDTAKRWPCRNCGEMLSRVWHGYDAVYCSDEECLDSRRKKPTILTSLGHWDRLTRDAKRLIITKLEEYEKAELDLMRKEYAVLREDYSTDAYMKEGELGDLILEHNKRRRRNIQLLMQGSKFKVPKI